MAAKRRPLFAEDGEHHTVRLNRRKVNHDDLPPGPRDIEAANDWRRDFLDKLGPTGQAALQHMAKERRWRVASAS